MSLNGTVRPAFIAALAFAAQACAAGPPEHVSQGAAIAAETASSEVQAPIGQDALRSRFEEF